MKKYLSFILSLAMMLLCFTVSIPISYAEIQPMLSIADVNGKAGETVEVDVKLSNNPGIIALSFDVEYDSNKLKLLKAEDGKILGTSTAVFGNDISANPYRLCWDDLSENNNEDNGVVATLTFEILENAKGDAKISLILNQGSTFNIDMEDVKFTVVGGNVSVRDFSEVMTTTTTSTTSESTTTSTTKATTTTSETKANETTTTTTGTTSTTESETSTIVSYIYSVETKTPQFYFSHDTEEFDSADLISGITRYAVYSDGSVSENSEVIENLNNVNFGGLTPEKLYTEDEYEYTVTASIIDVFGSQKIEAAGRVYIGVKGDANLDGSTDAIDAAVILVYAADAGAGKEAYLYSDTDTEAETFACFLADVNGTTSADSSLDAIDAAAILVYAAESGSGKDITWDEVLGTS